VRVRYRSSPTSHQCPPYPTVDGDATGASRERQGGSTRRGETWKLLLFVVLPVVLTAGFFSLLQLQIALVDRRIALLRYQSGLAEAAIAIVEQRRAEDESIPDTLRDVFVQAEESLAMFTKGAYAELSIHLIDERLAASRLESAWNMARGCLVSVPRQGLNPGEEGRACLAALVDESGRLIEASAVQSSALRAGLLHALAAGMLAALLTLYSNIFLLRRWLGRTGQLLSSVRERLRVAGWPRAVSLLQREETAQLPSLFDVVREDLQRLVQSVEQHARKADRIIESLPPSMLLVSVDHQILWVNRSYKEKFKVRISEVFGRPLKSVPPFRGDEGSIPSLEGSTFSGHGCLRTTCKDEGHVFLVTWIGCGSEDRAGLQYGVVLEEIADRRQLHRLLDRSTDCVLIINEHGRVAGLNLAAQRALLRSEDECAGLPLEAFMLHDSIGGADNPLSAVLGSDGWLRGEASFPVTLARRDGTILYTTITIGEFPSSSGHWLLASFRDDSQHRRTQLLARAQTELIEMVSRGRPLEESLSALVSMLQDQVAGAACAVMLRKGNRLHPFMAPKLPASYTQALTGLPIGPAEASCGTAAFKGELVVAEDIAHDPLWANYRDLARRHGLRACWSAPIHLSSGVLAGTLGLYLCEPIGPTDSHAELLETATRLAAVAIEHKQMTDELTRQARRDHLTGLPNRTAFQERFQWAVARAKRNSRPLAVLSLDLDRFKVINDTLGHAVGDGLLQQVARRLDSAVRETDVVARWGGDEFVVGLLELDNPEAVGLVAQKLSDRFKLPFEVEGHVLNLTATIGFSIYPSDGHDLATLLKSADMALYQGKNGHGNIVRSSPNSTGSRGRRPLDLEAGLRKALERGELVVYYQPEFDCHSGNVLGVEALLRWSHPELGIIPPAEFIPIAEESRLILPIGRWVLEQACRQLSTWREQGCHVGTVGINVSPLQFSQPDFLRTVAQAVAKTSLPPSLVELEITESLLIQDLDGAVRCCAELRELGVRIVLDDFGNGYSSLGSLHRLPIAGLKLDRSFVCDIGRSSRSGQMISHVVSLARSLGVYTTAEGIEDEVQLEAVRRAGCDRVQGFLLGRPSPALELSALISGDTARSMQPVLATDPPRPRAPANATDVPCVACEALVAWPHFPFKVPLGEEMGVVAGQE